MTFHLAVLAAAVIAVAAAADDRPLVIDPEYSVVEVEVQALMRDFRARLTHFRVNIAVDPAGKSVHSATFSFEWADLLTGNEARDRELLRWVDHTRFPSGRFHLREVECAPEGTIRVRGELMLHGVTHEISFPVRMLSDHDLVSVDGTAEIDSRDYGLPPVRRFRLRLVKPSVLVRFHLQGRLGPARPAN